MFHQEPNIFDAAAIAALEAVSCCDFSEDVLRESLNLPVSNESRQNENRLTTDIKARLGNPRLFASIAHLYDAFPKSAAEDNEYLAGYREGLLRNIETVRKDIANEAIEWARIQLEKEGDDAASFCGTDAASDWIYTGINMLVFGSSSTGKKKSDTREARYYNRLSAKMPKVAAIIESEGVQLDLDACTLIAAKELFNGLRPLMFYALAMMYGEYIMLGLIISLAGSPYALENVGSKTLIDDADFSDSVMAHSSILQALGPCGRVLVYDDFDSACTIAEITHPHLEAVYQLAQKVKSLQDAHLRAAKRWEVREKELNRTIDQQSKSLKGLQGNQGSDAIKPLMDELTAARNELAKLRGLLAIKEEKLAKLGAAEVSAPANKSSPSASSAPVPRASPAKQQEINPEDALAYLRRLKCVLVGGHTIFHEKIAQSLPNWTLYDADQTVVDDAHIRGADLVVFFTSHASHKQTKGVLKLTRQFGVPVAYAYKVNPQAFYVEVAQQAQRLQKPADQLS